MTVRTLLGDAREVLRTLPADHFHCVVTSPPYFGLRSYLPDLHPDKPREIGRELDVTSYVRAMVDVFREVRRVLRPDGVCWLNLGDSFAGSRCGPPGVTGEMSGQLSNGRPGAKPKDLLGIPWRVAFALQDDGWWLRRDCIWQKPNPMPESCSDRFTSSHEYVFHLTKSATYFFDIEDVREPFADDRMGRDGGRGHRTRNRGGRTDGLTCPAGIDPSANGGRNRRSVWTIASEPCAEAHFATMPSALADLCIRAATSAGGCCSSCGAPFRRVLMKGEPDLDRQRACGGDASGGYTGSSRKGHTAAGVQDASAVKARILAGMVKKRCVGWEPTCECNSAACAPCRVLDPFGGSGTTGIAADRLGRDATLVDLNPEYVAMAGRRVAADGGMFAELGLAPIPAP